LFFFFVWQLGYTSGAEIGIMKDLDLSIAQVCLLLFFSCANRPSMSIFCSFPSTFIKLIKSQVVYIKLLTVM